MKHITILGGGLAGWCLFEHLIRLGHDPESLLLIEKEVSANGASGVLEGMLHPFTGRTLYPKAGALEAWAYSKQWLLEQHNQSGLPIFTPKALWRIATDEKTREQFERSFLRAQAEISDYPVTPLNSTAPLEKVKAGYVFAGAGHVNIQQLLAYFQHRYRPHRLLHQSLRPLHKAPQGHWCITTETTQIKSRHVVLATGADLKAFFPNIPLRTKRGEVIHFRHSRHIPHCVSGGGRYLVPLNASGSGADEYIGGATFYRDAGVWPPAQAWKDLCSRFHWFPDIENAEVIRVWSGVRATLHPDREPLCGPVPEQEGLWLMSAFSTRGLLQIPRHARALAHTLSDLDLTGLPPESQPERLRHFKFLKKAGIDPFAGSPCITE